MSRLRADEVLSKDALGPFLATEGINIPVGKNITFNDASEPTVLDGTSLTTSTLTLDQVKTLSKFLVTLYATLNNFS